MVRTSGWSRLPELEATLEEEDMSLSNKLGRGDSSLVVKAIIMLGIVSFLSGCIKGGSETTWSAESHSPDGKRVATAFTIEQSGFGTGGGGTDVYLNFTAGSQPKQLILAFSDGPSGPGGMYVGMKWLTPIRLELTYKGQRSLDFQAVKCYGVDISVRVLASEAPPSNAIKGMWSRPSPPPFAYQKTGVSQASH